MSAAVSDHLDELEEQTPLASLRPVDRKAQVFAANVYGSSTAAYLQFPGRATTPRSAPLRRTIHQRE